MPCESTADEAFIEWSHHRISSTDSKVRSTLTMSGGERVNRSQIEQKQGIQGQKKSLAVNHFMHLSHFVSSHLLDMYSAVEESSLWELQRQKNSFSPIDYETKRMTMDFSCTYCRVLVCSSFFLLETLGGQLLNIALLFPVKINYRENLLVSTVNLKNKMPLFPHFDHSSWNHEKYPCECCSQGYENSIIWKGQCKA